LKRLVLDVDWYWIVRTDGQEGFVPSAFVYPAENILQNQETLTSSSANNLNNNNNNTTAANGNFMTLSSSNNSATFNATNINQQCQQQSQQQQSTQPLQMQDEFASQDDLRYHGTELVVLYDYKAQAPDDLSVRRGEIIYADLNNQTVDGWLWCYAPKASKKCGKYGFIPKSYTHTYNRQNTSV
jgi:hypothetical protein